MGKIGVMLVVLMTLGYFATDLTGSAQRTEKIGVVSDIGGRGDLSFNDMAFKGAQMAQKDFGIETVEVISITESDYLPNLRMLAERGDCALIVAIGFLLADALEVVAKEYPNQKFAIVDAEVDAPNVVSILFKENEGSALAGALAIQGHHVGLQRGASSTLRGMDLDKLAVRHPFNLHLSDPNKDRLVQRAQVDGLQFNPPTSAAMLGVRLLFSCLVDADFLDTEAHFEGDAQGKRPRVPGPALDAQAGLDALNRYMGERIRASTQADAQVLAAREALWRATGDAQRCKRWTPKNASAAVLARCNRLAHSGLTTIGRYG